MYGCKSVFCLSCLLLSQAFASNHTLTRLDLSHTCVSDEGAKALCDAMQYNSTLEVQEARSLAHTHTHTHTHTHIL